MFIQRKYAAIAVKYTDTNRKNQGVEFDEALLENYRAMLKEKVNSRNIEEGRELEYDDWLEVYNGIVNIMNSSVELVRSRNEAFRSNVKSYKYVFSALNYLLAITESELGSPEIPVNEFRFNYSPWLSTIIYNKPMAEISEKEVYNSQRRMNADLLQSKKIQPLLEGLNDEDNISRNIGELYAEYRALVRRQANHGFFWRIFHMSENAARTDLIKQLEEVLKNYIPDLNLNSEIKVLPTTIGKSAEKELAVHRFNSSTALYGRNLSDVFGYEENGLDSDPAENEQIQNEQIQNEQIQNEQIQNEQIQNEQIQNKQNNIISQSSELEIIDGEDEKADEIDESVSNEENQNVIEEDNNEKANEEVIEEANEEVNEEKANEEEIEEQKNEPVEVINEISEDDDITLDEILEIISSEDFAAQLADAIWKAIDVKVDRSIKKEAVTGDIVNKMISAATTFNEVYYDVKAVGDDTEKLNEVIDDSMTLIYSEAFNSLDGCNMEITDQVVSAQKVSDIVLNKATVVGFNGAKYSKFANNYAISNETLVSEALEFSGRNLSEDSINAIVSNAKRELNVKEAPKPSVVEDEVNASIQEINAEPNIEEKVQAEPEIVEEILNDEAPVNEEVLENKEDILTEAKEEENITPAEFAFINNQANNNIGNPQLTASVKGQMRGILANSGVDMSKVNETVDIIFNNCLFDRDDGIAAYYHFVNADMSASLKSRSVSSIMDMMIKSVGNNLRAPLNGSISDPADRMVAHQKLLDVFLKSYSPAALAENIDEKYLNNYFLDDSKNLETYYRTYINKNASEADVEGFAKSVAEARVRIENSNIVVEAPEVEEQPELEVQEQPELEVQEQPKIEAQEQPKVEAEPQVEETHIADIELTVGENITPAEFSYIFNRADKSAGNSQLTESVKGQMREILANSGIDKSKVNETVDKVFNKSLFDSDDGLAAYYRHINADMSASAKARSSSSIMEMMIKGAGNNIHLALNGSFSNAVEQMIVHQKLLDVLLKNYSPAAFTKGIDEKYLNNYYLDDSKNLESYYRSYINKNASARDVEGFVKSVSGIHVKNEGVDNSKVEEARRKAEEERSLEEKKLKELAVEKAELDKERITLEEALKNSEAQLVAVDQELAKLDERAALANEYIEINKERVKLEETLRNSEQELTTLNEEIAKLDNQLVLEQERVRIEAEEAKRKAEEEEAKRKASEDPSAEEARKLKIQQNVAEAIAADNTPHVNIRMHKQCVDAVNNNELAQSVRQQLKNIKDDHELINDVCRLPREKILNIYRNATANNTNMYSRLAATEMVRELFIDIYRLTVKHDYTNMGMRVFMAQEMTDVLMRNYSPVAFVPKVFDDAADYYIVGHKSILNNTMSKAHPNIYNYYSEKEKDKVVDYGRSSKEGTGQVEAYIKRRDSRKKELQEYIDQNKAMGANVLDRDYIREDVISAYRVQYLDACGATKAIKANVNDVKTILDKAGVNESDKNAQKFVDGIMFEMPSIYDNASHFARLNGTFGDMMSYMSKEVFYRAYGNIQNYDGINEITRLALAQQLADVILKAYSPAKFNDACKPEYTNGFAISDVANIKVALEKNDIKLTDEEISQLKEDVAYANEHLGEALGEGKVDIIAEYKRSEEQKRLDEEARIKAEEEAKIKAEEEEARRKAEEEEARRKAEEEEARRKAEEEAKVKVNKAEPDASARYKRESKKIPLKLGKNINVDSISDIYKEFLLSRSDDNLTASVKAQLAEILLKNGVERSKVGGMVKNGFPIIINEMDNLYKKHVAEAIYRDTPEVVTLYFFGWLASSFYDKFASFESAEENVVLIQKIADVFFKNYSPVAFTDGVLDKYADNYQINHPRELIEDFGILHTKYGGEVTPELKAAIEEAKNKLNSIELENKDIKVEDFEKEIPIEEIVKEEKPKVAPKEEPKVAPKEEPKVAPKEEPKAAPKEEPKVEEKPKYERKVVEKYERKVERREIGTGKESELTNDDLNFLYNECKKSIGDPKLTEYVKSQIGEILFVSGVDESKIQTTVDNITDKCFSNLGMTSFYNKNFNSRYIGGKTAESATDLMVNIMAGYLQSVTDKTYSSHEEALVVNQKILDVLLKNYSPVAFLKNDLSKYADNYMFKDDNRILAYCEKYLYRGNYDEKKAFLERVKSVRENIESKFKADASKIEVKDDKAPIREQIMVDMSAVDAPKVNASRADEPKVEAPKVDVNNPSRERIVVNEALGNADAAQVSDKVKEIKAPVNSKSKE